jgi:hypothetical protein
MPKEFPYGEVFPPEPSGLHFLTGEPRRKQMCITSDLLPKLARVRPEVPRLAWQQHSRHVFSVEFQQGRALSVIRFSQGWRAFRRFFDEGSADMRFDLCYALSDNAATFPCSVSAIDAAEIFSFAQYWDVVPLVWVNARGEYRCEDPIFPPQSTNIGRRSKLELIV